MLLHIQIKLRLQWSPNITKCQGTAQFTTFNIMGVCYKQNPDIMTLLKKIQQNFVIQELITKCHFADDDNASESCNLHVVDTKNK